LSEPLYFSADNSRLFGWLHRPGAARTSDLGMVICKPFGYEAICGHRTMRTLADSAAGLGVPVLRFDYRGTGDSADGDASADQIEVWLRDVAAAISTLRRCAGVSRVCLLGFRLGALLAALAAAGRAGVDALILVAPVIEGRRYVRELRTTALAAAANVSANPADKRAARDGAIEAGGFLLSAASIARLSQVNLTTLTEAPASEVLIIDRDDLPAARAWGETLSSSGAHARYVALPGFVKMMMTPPQFAAVPQALVALIQQWLQQLAGPADKTSPQAEVSGSGASWDGVELALPCTAATPDSSLHERPVELDPEPRLFGIVTEPVRDERRRRAVILVNSGADYHIGAGRMYVAMARRWAAQGYVALRMDLRGIGDSETPRGGAHDAVFPAGAIADIAAAVDFTRRHYGVREVTLAGLCSAAYHVLRAAVEGLEVNRILMVNPQNFSWREGMSVDAVQLVDVVKDLQRERRRTLSFATLKRLLTGRIDLATVARIYLQRARIAVESSVREAARAVHIRLPRDLGWELQDIAARGVRVVFVFAAGDPGIELLRIQGGSVVRRLGDRCRVHVIDSADHTFTRIGPRARLEQVLSEELFAPGT
jgi:alpha-beta hydrolase superfamily lysophospholipase